MTTFPPRAGAVLLGELPGCSIAYDVESGVRHHLDVAAGQVLAACDGVTDRDAFIARQAAESGVAPEVVAAKVDDALTRFDELGFITRQAAVTRPPARVGAPEHSDEATIVGPAHRVLDLQIHFRGTQPDLLDEIDDYLGTAEPLRGEGEPHGDDRGSTLFFDVHRHDNGAVDLVSDETAGHDDLGTLLLRLVSVIGDYAVQTQRCTVLHAGGVRTPSGQIVLLAAPSGSGKSTLTAALVASRWDYLSDDMIGIDRDGRALGYPKRIGLDPVSRRVVGLGHSPDATEDVSLLYTDVQRLGGVVAEPDLVVFPEYQAGADCATTPLDPVEAVDTLITNSLNLAIMGDDGLAAICDLAVRVPAYRLIHGDAIEAAEAVTRLLES